MATQLETLADKFRQESIARNAYTTKGIYDSNHKNAISDGDEKGKADIGSSIDIQNRISSLIEKAEKNRITQRQKKIANRRFGPLEPMLVNQFNA